MTRTILALFIAAGLLTITAPGAEAQRRPADRITREEIDASPHRGLNIHEFIRRTRPAFLESRTRGASLVVYLDARRQESIDVLKSIVASSVQDVVYFEPARAASEFGAQAANGAIVVKLRRDARPDRPE